jgi:hypothetical protein
VRVLAPPYWGYLVSNCTIAGIQRGQQRNFRALRSAGGAGFASALLALRLPSRSRCLFAALTRSLAAWSWGRGAGIGDTQRVPAPAQLSAFARITR